MLRSCRPLSPLWSTERCSGSSPGSAFLQLWVPGELSGPQGAPAAPSSSCSQGALISVSSKLSPKGGELLFALIVARFDCSGSCTCVSTALFLQGGG